MTVLAVVPVVEYVGDGIETTFAWDWEMIDDSAINVLVDNTYVDETWSVVGMDVVFTTPPADQADIVIFRRTTVWMPEDYRTFGRFSSDKTELSMDRNMMIAQEIDGAAILDGQPLGMVGGADLRTLLGRFSLTVFSERGTDAVLEMWKPDADEAGVFAGEVTTNAPANDAPTNNTKGYEWMEYGESAESVWPDNFIYFDFQGNSYTTTTATPHFIEVGKYYGKVAQPFTMMRLKGINVNSNWTDIAGSGIRGNNCLVQQSTNNPAARLQSIFDSSGSYSPVDMPKFWTSNPYCIGFWFYPVNFTNPQTVFTSGEYTNDTGTHLTIKTDGTVEWKSGVNIQASVATLTLNQWNLVMINHDPSTQKVGISVNDAALEETVFATPVPQLANQQVFHIGCRVTTSSNYDQFIPVNSRLDQFMMFGTIRTQAQVDRIWNNGNGLKSYEFFQVSPYNSAYPAGGWDNRVGLGPPDAWLDVSFEDTVMKSAGTEQWSQYRCVNNDGASRFYNKHYGNDNSYNERQAQATYLTNIQNGHPIVRFVATSAYMNGDWKIGTSTQTGYTIFFCGSTINDGVIFQMAEGGTNSLTIRAVTGGGIAFFARDAGNTYYVPTPANKLVGAGVFFVGAVTFDGDNNVTNIYMNGELVATAGGPNFINISDGYGIIGSEKWNSLVNPWSGDFGELVAYAYPFNHDSVVSQTTALNDKWAAY